MRSRSCPLVPIIVSVQQTISRRVDTDSDETTDAVIRSLLSDAQGFGEDDQ